MKKDKYVLASKVIDEKKMYEFNLTFFVFKENDYYIAYCPMLDLSTSGDTKQEAVQNFPEAFEAFIECCVEKNILKECLTSLGWRVSTKRILPPPLSKLAHKEGVKELLDGENYFERRVIPVQLPLAA